MTPGEAVGHDVLRRPAPGPEQRARGEEERRRRVSHRGATRWRNKAPADSDTGEESRTREVAHKRHHRFGPPPPRQRLHLTKTRRVVRPQYPPVFPSKKKIPG